MSERVRLVGPGDGPTTTVLLAVGYLLVSLLVDPLSAPALPGIRPTAGLPVLFGLVFGPVGVLGAVSGAILESTFAGGGPVYSAGVVVWAGTVAAVAWRCSGQGTGSRTPTDLRGLGRSLVLPTLAAATVGNAVFGTVAAAFGGYPVAPLAIGGTVETVLSTFAVAVVLLALVRFGLAEPSSLGVARSPLSRSLAVTAIAALWLAVAVGLDTVVHDFTRLPPAVVEQYLPHRVVGPVEFAVGTDWFVALLQLGVGVVAVASLGQLLRSEQDGGSTGDGSEKQERTTRRRVEEPANE